MKKTFTPIAFLIFCSCGLFMSCSKDVQKPSKTSNSAIASATNNTTNTTSQNSNNQNRGSGHTCSGSGSANYGNSGF